MTGGNVPGDNVLHMVVPQINLGGPAHGNTLLQVFHELEVIRLCSKGSVSHHKCYIMDQQTEQ